MGQQTLIINSVETLKSIITKTKSITESEEGSISCSEFTSSVETIMGLVNSEGPANEIQALVAQLGSGTYTKCEDDDLKILDASEVAATTLKETKSMQLK